MKLKQKRLRKIRQVMREFKNGTLDRSYGGKVTNRKQAIAIALSEGNRLRKYNKHYFLNDMAEFQRGRKVKATKVKTKLNPNLAAGNEKTFITNWATPDYNSYEDLQKSRSLIKPFALKSNSVLYRTVKPNDLFTNRQIRTRELIKPSRYTDREVFLQNKPSHKSPIIQVSIINDKYGDSHTKPLLKTDITNNKTKKTRTLHRKTKKTFNLPESQIEKTVSNVSTNGLMKNVKPTKLNKYLLGGGIVTGGLGLAGLGYLGYKRITNKKRRNK